MSEADPVEAVAAVAPAPPAGRERAVAAWLFAVAAMVVVMVVLGGLTRLTHSGLSIVEWKPLTGWLPPLSEAAWADAFAQYRRFPEYQKLNAGMTLDDFKGIFWLEYVHRLWGRLIGIAFLVPLVAFVAGGWIARRLVPGLVGLLVLGGLQGAMGWYMVASGLVDDPDVSQYRLVAHLGLALVILGALLWIAIGLVAPAPARRIAPGLARAVLALVFLTALSGGFVAGLDAGFIFNTFPRMEGQWIPDDVYTDRPFFMSAFEDPITVQFNHRILAVVVLAAVGALWARAARASPAPRQRRAAGVLAAAAAVQAGFGVATLVLVVPVALGALHQAGAVALFAAAVWAAHDLAGARAGPAA